MKRFKLVLALLLSLSSVAAYADGSTWTDVKMTNIAVYTSAASAPKGYVVVTFAANGTGTPSCASGYPRNLVIDLSTAAGAFAASVLQGARLIGETLNAKGTGTCSVIPTAETLASVQTAAH